MQLLKIWIPVLLAAAAFLSACSDEELGDVYPEKEETAADGNIYIRFRMNLSGIPGSTRAEGGDAPTTPDTPTEPKTPREEVIESILILIYDAKTGILINKVKTKDESIIKAIQTNTGAVIPIYNNMAGEFHIYAALNLPEQLQQRYIVGESDKDVSFSSSGANYWDVINEIVPGTDGLQQKLESNSGTIPMTGQFKTKTVNNEITDRIIITEENATKDNPLTISADVSRIVAKVHVLVQCVTETDPNTNKPIEYAQSSYTKDNNTEPERIGWILPDDVRYIPNGTNKSTYILQKNNTGKPVDMNMNLESYVATVFSSDNAPKFGFNAIQWAKDFSFCDGLSLHKENISEKSHFSKVEPFDAKKYNNTTTQNTNGGYTQGMYCPENYFDNPETYAASFDSYKEAIPMVTHVYIAAKLFPKWIVIESDFETNMSKFVSEYTTKKEQFLKEEYGITEKDFNESDVARWNTIKDKYFTNSTFLYTATNFLFIEAQSKEDAADFIKWSLIINEMYSSSPADFENGKYPEGTFFTYEKGFIPAEAETEAETKSVQTKEYPLQYLYLTAGAFNNATGNISYVKTYSVPHVGGWCYYFTYLDDPKNPDAPQTGNGKTPYTSSQVTRNTYYLIKVSNFGFPGGSISRPEYIKVNTETIEWDNGGQGKITLH